MASCGGPKSRIPCNLKALDVALRRARRENWSSVLECGPSNCFVGGDKRLFLLSPIGPRERFQHCIALGRLVGGNFTVRRKSVHGVKSDTKNFWRVLQF